MRALLLGLLALSAPALGCGICVDDKVAAVYDHALLQRAFAAKHTVAFFALDGKLIDDERTRRAIAGQARLLPGVDPASVRVSTTLASLCVVFDGRRTSLVKVQDGLERRLAGMGLSLLPLQVRER